MDLVTPEKIKLFIEGIIILVLSISVHEFGHAIVADKLGDRLPRQQGRVTLNPVAHADPLGTLALPGIPLLLFGFMGFGWGRPVQVNPAAFSRRFSIRTGHLLVAAAGPSMNILFGMTISLILLVLYHAQVVAPETALYGALTKAIFLNFGLAIFNLIPAPPLDGGTVLAGVLPSRMLPTYHRYAQYGIFILLAFFMIPGLSAIIRIPALFLYKTWAIQILGLPLPG
jgi:Zn-dependent protease